MNEPCGCCKVSVGPTPVEITNRPGLSTIAYRVGAYATFRQAMLTAISQVKVEGDGQPLRSWTARLSEDYGIALLEMWAYLADILTFYQERIANEAYLRTALQRASVMRLANLIGYELASGVAAKAYLAFTLDKGASIQITPRLRVQSIPAQGESPQKFETVESITGREVLNKFRIYPEPQLYDTLANDKSDATILSDVSDIKPTDNIVIFDSTHVENKEITANEKVDWRQVLRWKPAILDGFHSDAAAYKWRRKYRLAGHDAPPQIFSGSINEHNVLVWSQTPFDYFLSSDHTLKLDAVYDNLKANTSILLVSALEDDGTAIMKLTVNSVEQVNAEVLPSTSVAAPAMQSTVTQITVEEDLPEGIDVRTAVLYELDGNAVTFWNKQYHDTLSGNAIYIPLVELVNPSGAEYTAAEAAQLFEANRYLILEDGLAAPQVVTVNSSQVVEDHLKIMLNSAIDTTLQSTTATAYANVVLSTHGETVSNETLGSGDASKSFQSFTLKKSPVTFVPKAGAKNGAANTLSVNVAGILWQEVDTLYGQDKQVRVYTTRIGDGGEMTIQFGDGQTGARLPTGKNNLLATYRQGIGKSGNLAAESLTTPLDKPTGLKKVTNPLPASGGADPENLSKARQNAPNTVRTLGRIVSLRDFEDAAREHAGIAKARAFWQWDGMERAVILTVAGDDGAAIPTGSTIHADLVADLNSRRDPHRKLTVKSYLPVPLQLVAAIQTSADQDSATVQAQALAALGQYFDFDNLELGQPVHLSNVMSILQGVSGVEAVDVDLLQYKEAADRAAHGASAEAVQAHLNIIPDELATIENPASDLVIKIGLSQL